MTYGSCLFEPFVVTVTMNTGNTVRLYYGGPLWEVLRSSPGGTGSACVLCVRKRGRREMAIYRVCDLVSINGGEPSALARCAEHATNRLRPGMRRDIPDKNSALL